MENFDWTSFTRKITIGATIDKLYDAWTKPAELEKWFLKHAEYFDAAGNPIDKYENISDGSRHEWQWFNFDGVEHGKTHYANGKDHIQFTFAGDCIVDVHLSQQENSALVELTQKNIPTDDESKVNIRIGCDAGWSFFLVNLKSYYENGHDLRNKDESIKGLING